MSAWPVELRLDRSVKSLARPGIGVKARPDRHTLCAVFDAFRPFGGLAIVASMFLPWVDRGGGSTVPLRSLGDVVLAGDLGDRAPPWVGLIVYLIPLAGALVVLADGLGARGRLLGVSALTVATLLVGTGVVVPLLRDRLPGPGQWVAVMGLALIGSAEALDRRRMGRSIPVRPGPGGSARATRRRVDP